ncbi:unnamed protein product [Rhizophagus irregularis]|nr:unnamed protein product [Rhizophagus irregularis]
MLLIKELVNNKVHFERLEENQFYLKNFTFKNELFYNSPRILFDVKKSLPQEPIVEKTTLVLTMFQPILTLNPGNSIDLFELLSIFDIILSFIKELSISHSDMLIMDFVNQWLKLAKLDTSKYKIFSDFSLKHIVELYELIEEQNVNNSIIHNINDKFKVTLSQQMKKSINNFIDYFDQDDDLIPATEFLLALKRFIYRFLSIDTTTNIENINLNIFFLDFTLNLWPDYIKKDLIENLFPNCLLVSHTYNCYIYIINEIEKAVST